MIIKRGEIKVRKSKLFFISIVALFFVFLVACNDNSNNAEGEDKKDLIIGTSPGPYSELFLDAIKPILEDQGYTIKDQDFTELLLADVALAEGAVDLNVDQHTAYMNNFNEEKDANLTAITPIPTVPAGIFPGRKTSLEEIEDGDVIGIPQDPSNAARAYAVLQKAGLIKLEEGVELVSASAQDIVENPHNLEITEMDSYQIPRALADLDYGVIPGSIVYSSGIDAATSLISEDILKDLELVVVVDEKNKDTKWAKDIKAAYESDEFKAYLEEHNQDGYWFVPEELQ